MHHDPYISNKYSSRSYKSNFLFQAGAYTVDNKTFGIFTCPMYMSPFEKSDLLDNLEQLKGKISYFGGDVNPLK